MPGDKNTFKPPKPRVFSGEGLDKDPAVFDAWKNEVIDYLDLLGIADDKVKVTILQYLVSNTAKDYYTTRREAQTLDQPLSLNDILDGIRQHVVPSTHGNEYWKQWESISQIHNGRIRGIGLVAIEVQKLAQRIGDVGDNVKLQKFLGAMHPELRLRVETTINKKKFVWSEVVQQAEAADDALRQAGKYSKGGGRQSNATQQYTPKGPRNSKKPQGQQQKKTWPPRTGNKQNYEKRKDRKSTRLNSSHSTLSRMPSSA